MNVSVSDSEYRTKPPKSNSQHRRPAYSVRKAPLPKNGLCIATVTQAKMEIKILGLRIVGVKPNYLEATVPLEQSKRPVAPEKDSRSSSDGSGSQTSDRSLLSSGVSSQQSTDNLRAEFWTIQSLTDEVQKKPSGSSLECV